MLSLNQLHRAHADTSIGKYTDAAKILLSWFEWKERDMADAYSRRYFYHLLTELASKYRLLHSHIIVLRDNILSQIPEAKSENTRTTLAQDIFVLNEILADYKSSQELWMQLHLLQPKPNSVLFEPWLDKALMHMRDWLSLQATIGDSARMLNQHYDKFDHARQVALSRLDAEMPARAKETLLLTLQAEFLKSITPLIILTAATGSTNQQVAIASFFDRHNLEKWCIAALQAELDYHHLSSAWLFNKE